jgi:hypothetical protein
MWATVSEVMGMGPMLPQSSSQPADRARLYAVDNTPATMPRGGWLTAVRDYVRSAPLTYCWLTLLLFTTVFQHSLPPRRLHAVLVHHSTNLHHLATDPVYVLFSSLLWIDGRYWMPYLVLFSVFLAPAERWLGKWRWATVGLIAHLGATYLSEGFLYLAIQHGLAPERMVNARDIGVSYFLVGIVGVLSYHIARPWRWGYLAAIILVFGVVFVLNPRFTPFGHFCSLLIGLACYPLTRGRDRPTWNPVHIGVVRRRLGTLPK